MSNMESASKKELLQLISKQNDQLTRYKARLNDVVAAYKGLTNEKEALEASLKALNGSQISTDKALLQTSKPHDAGNDKGTESESKSVAKEAMHQHEETTDQLRAQLTTLMNSLATLSSEKSRMEQSFQSDKKQLRLEKEEREKTIKELQEKIQQLIRQHQSEIEHIKSKLIMERHERDKEQNDHGIMIRELQKLLSDERHTKVQLETQVEEMRTKLMHLESQSGRKEKKLQDVHNELEIARQKVKKAETKAKETPPLLLELQEEMDNMKMRHQLAILEEQKRAVEAEDRARKLAALHEERVANLEARLAELSDTVGSYDRLRQQDQLAIHRLKEHIAQINIDHNSSANIAVDIEDEDELKGKSEADSSLDVQSLVEQILHLKGLLIMASQRSEKPVDIDAILNVMEPSNRDKFDDHKACREEYQQLKKDFEVYKLMVTQQANNSRGENHQCETASLKAQIKSLRERVRILSSQLDDMEKESKQNTDQQQRLLKVEREKHKDELAASEADYRGRISLLETQLQKQRERSITLLEEKEQEIQTLKSTFQMFLPGNTTKVSPLDAGIENKEVSSGGSDDVMSSLSQFGGMVRGLGPTSGGESPHMLHYAHELARRDVEISNLRKTKHRLECALRELQRAVATEDERHQDVTGRLQEEVARLERCKSRESANLEYLKNVVLSFLLTNDSSSKRHMLNAIAAVLKFSNAELERVNKVHRTSVQASPK